MNVPKLRFKDDDGRPFPEWESNLLGSYAEAISSGKSNARNGNGRYILYGSTGSIGYADDYDYQGEKLLIARVGANAGYLYRVEGDYCVSDNTLMLTLKQPHNYSFFFNLLTKKNLNKLVFGSGQPLITGGHLKNLEVSVPSLPEQTKIANFLTAVDEKVTQLTQKSELLTQYKKGVMQKIFSQELRFKDDDGREFPEWEEKQLGEVAIINPKTNSLPSEFVYIDLESVEKGNLLKETLITKDDAPSRAQRILEKEDVLFQMVRPYQGNNLFFDKSGEYVASTGYAQIRPYENARFIYHYLHLESFVAEVINRCTGTSYPAINANDLATISVQIPYLKEQTKIANFLTAIDDKITQTQAELDAVKQYKQGLLQQMFV